jgi:DHA2 family multidrug resistance protein-like MFS transporter
LLPAQPRGIALSGLSGALAVAHQIGGSAGDQLAQAAKSAFVDGIGLATIVGAAIVFSAALAARFVLPHGSFDTDPAVLGARFGASEPAETVDDEPVAAVD